MATRKGAQAPKGGKGERQRGVFDYDPNASWLAAAMSAKASGKGGVKATFVYGGPKTKVSDVKTALDAAPAAWLAARLEKRRGELVTVQQDGGPAFVYLAEAKASAGHGGQLDPSGYAAARDAAGFLVGVCGDLGVTELAIVCLSDDEGAELGLLVGLELGSYRYKWSRQGGAPAVPALKLAKSQAALVESAATIGTATNLARHLVNLPPCDLNPESYADAIERLFAGKAGVSVEVWDDKRLAKEGCGLLVAVGQAATARSRLVRVSYRPKGSKNAPLAFVGKGITFDSGGLDLKDAASMRLMKKDMGGSASVVGVAQWVVASGLPLACDFYVALAENAVSAEAFHPGDVIKARNGMTVEIDNTDAEGRLVLADALDVAVTRTGADKPTAVIDMATLTGAMRIGLGTRIAGMFSTSEPLSASYLEAAQRRGEPAWRMPLFPEYFAQLKSTAADFANSGGGRFGGAITAALFMQKFVRDVPWMHFDIYCWQEGPNGALQEAGGNGPCVQAMAAWLEELSEA
jgi:leucyl aminopeptidase